jgi:MYXO-CTERM domain-containing protein
MKTTSTRSTKSATISNSRWLSYATAGAASAFAAANSAEGTIHYSGPINRIFKECQAANFRLDRPGDFIRLRHSSFLVCDTSFNGNAFFNVAGIAGASIAGFYDDCGRVSASNLKRGQLISSRPFVPAQSFRSADLAGYCPGQFLGGIGFIGFKFNNGSGAQYGWVRIQVKPGVGYPKYNFKLLDYAYGDVGDRVKAGQKSSSDIATDQSSLGWLALGAVGLLAWRRTRQQ